MDVDGTFVKPEQPNGYKFETLVLDMVHMMDDCIPYEVVREREFAPIKNLHGVDSLDTARELLKAAALHYNTFAKTAALQKKSKKEHENRVKWAFARESCRRPFCAKDQRKSKKFRKNNRKRRKITKI